MPSWVGVLDAPGESGDGTPSGPDCGTRGACPPWSGRGVFLCGGRSRLDEIVASLARDQPGDDGAEARYASGEALRAMLEIDPSGVAVVADGGASGLTVQLANHAFRAAMPDPALEPVGRTLE